MPSLSCTHCGTPYHVKPSKVLTARYCSQKCTKAAQSYRAPNRECEQCGKAYRAFPCQLTRTRFCSDICARTSRNLRVPSTCVYCGVIFLVARSKAATRVVCSRACKAKLWSVQAEQEAKENPNAVCKYCGEKFRRRPSQLLRSSGGYCSAACHDHARRGQNNAVCDQCGAGYHVRPQVAATRRFCSVACGRMYRGETSIERMIREALDRLGLEFIQEYAIGRYSLDFYIPSLATAIEADGDYWHRRREEQDARRDAFVNSRGIRVIRITESDLQATDATILITRALRDASSDSSARLTPPS